VPAIAHSTRIVLAAILLSLLAVHAVPAVATAQLHFRGTVRAVNVKHGTADVRGGPFAWMPMKLTTTLRIIPASSARRLRRGDVIDGVVNPNKTPWTLSSVHVVNRAPAKSKTYQRKHTHSHTTPHAHASSI
jgi:hypothetical protein